MYFHWGKAALSCLLGFLTGISLAAGILASLQNRTLITLLLGMLILPGLAVYASFLAGSSPQAFEAASSVLIPFLSYALAALFGDIVIMKIWRSIPVRERKEEAEKEPVPVVTQRKKE
jgi:membrane protein DedA with SNARE-associated domain